jgi:hypothetical protein
MTTFELKNNFHQLIDSIDNENFLQMFYDLMLLKKSSENGKLWAKLSEEEIDELVVANEECEYPDNLIPHEEMKNKYSKWL